MSRLLARHYKPAEKQVKQEDKPKRRTPVKKTTPKPEK